MTKKWLPLSLDPKEHIAQIKKLEIPLGLVSKDWDTKLLKLDISKEKNTNLLIFWQIGFWKFC